MKVAILISGFPRFTREFDEFLNQLGSEDVSFFFHLWDADRSDDQRIPHCWVKGNRQWVYDKISSNLKVNQRIVHLGIEPQPQYISLGKFKLTPWSVESNIWKMYLGLKQVSDIVRQYEQQNGKFDLVIRMRADAGLDKDIDFKKIVQMLSRNPRSVIMPDNLRNGLSGNPVNDQCAIGFSDTMYDYCRVFDHLDQYHNEGMIFHGETVLSHHLKACKIECPSSGYNIRIRFYFNPPTSRLDSELDHGRWS